MNDPNPLSVTRANSFSTIFEQSPISTQIFSPDGVSIKANRAWEKLWGVEHSKIGIYNVLKDKQLVKTGTMPYIKRGFKGEAVTIPAIKYEPSKTVPIKGAVQYRWVGALIYPVRDKNGKIVEVVLQHLDVTESKLAEERLRESRERLKATWEAAVDAMALSDPSGTVLEANTAYFNLYGYTREEVIGNNFAIIFPKHIRKWANEMYKKTFKSPKRAAVVESTVVSKQGKEHFVESRYSFIEQNGKRVAMLSVVSDITKRKQAEQILQHERERLRLALAAGNIGVWDWDIQQNKLTWTEKVYELHGVRKRKTPITFKDFQRLIHPEDKKRVMQSIENALHDKHEFNINLRVTPPKGKTRWLTTRGIVSYDTKGNPVRMLGATSDITEQKMLEQDKNDFISISTHELKTPVTSLKAYAEVLERRFLKSGDTVSAKHMAKMNAQLNKLTSLIGDLLDATKIESGKLFMHEENFMFDELVEEVVNELQMTTEKHTLITEGKTNKEIHADRERIGQVLTNLISNAIKYSPREGKIIVKLWAKTTNIGVCVKDYGIGISKEKQAKIFERFYRASGPKENTFPGLGLGLYISSEIIKRAHGKIWVDSAKGKGSAFCFTLPVIGPALKKQ